MRTLAKVTPFPRPIPDPTSKKILLIHLESLFPKVMASQERVYRIAERLAKEHMVDVATTVRDDVELNESKKHLSAVCRHFYPIEPINPMGSQWKRKTRRIEYFLKNCFLHHPYHYFYGGHHRVMAQLANIIKRNRYDIVQAEYWYMAKIFGFIDPGIFKVIDTHDVLFDKKRQQIFQRYSQHLPFFKRSEVDVYRELEIQHLKLADMIISISSADQRMLTDLHLGNQNLLMPIGQDIDYFKVDTTIGKKDNIVLFYGSMGGQENIDGFFRLWNQIMPLLKRRVPNVKLLVVGANPPETIKALHNGEDVVVTGFVDDVRAYLSRAKVALIPLDVAAGFRGRAVEIMSMEVPVVGTHRALDCLQIQHGVHGFISDSNADMAEYAADLLLDDKWSADMGASARRLVADRYSIEGTIGKLSEYYLLLPTARRMAA